MAEDDRDARDAAAAVLARHGPDARAFAAERLAFCQATAFADGVALWSAILDHLTDMAPKTPAQRQVGEG